MFVDQAQIKIAAGNGGNGLMSFRRERFVARGGPDGGDGGKGGDVVARVKDSIHGLAEYRNNKIIRAENGQNGGKQNKHGKNGLDTEIFVPKGTVIKNGEEVVAELLNTDDRIVIAKGGKGGFGNAHFKSSTRQAPKIAERGEPGESYDLLKLELKLIADVGLVGLPNAGKSTFLSVVSNAKPKIANYPFTTLEPNLGIVDIDDSSFVIADIPGLIEGASEGRGLGDDFLRHIERTSVLLHLVDISDENYVQNYKTIIKELKNYRVDLSKRKQILVATKIDLVDSTEQKKRVTNLNKISKVKALKLSSVKKDGLSQLLKELKKQIDNEKSKQKTQPVEKANSLPVFELEEKEIESSWSIEKEGSVFVVKGQKIEKFARRLDLSDYYAQMRIKDIMFKMGIMQELERLNVRVNDKVRIGDQEFTLQ